MASLLQLCYFGKILTELKNNQFQFLNEGDFKIINYFKYFCGIKRSKG